MGDRDAIRESRATRGRAVRWARLAGFVTVVLLAMPGLGRAERFQWGEVELSFDTYLTTSMSLRTQGLECLQIAEVNGGCNVIEDDPALSGVLNGRLLNSDDGNLNVDRGDVYSVLVSVGHDIDLSWRNYGAFTRLLYFYDAMQVTNWDGYTPRRTPYAEEARWRGSVTRGGVVGVSFRFLDAYAWARYKPFGRRTEIRFGNQVVNWGEEYFTQGGIKATNSIDVTKVRIAGAELKEGLVPAPMVRLSMDVVGDLSFETYYQFDWNPTELDPTGTFWSINDMVARGAQGQFLFQDPGTLGYSPEQLIAGGPLVGPPVNPGEPLTGGVPRGPTQEADDQGQWGAAFRYYWDAIETELGLYYVRFHDKLPTVSYVGQGLSAGDVFYFTEYIEKVNLYGLSFNTTLGGVAFAGELSLRANQPTPISSAYTDLLENLGVGEERGMVREPRITAIVNALYVASPTTLGFGPVIRALGAQDLTMIGEIAVVNYPWLDDDVSYASPNGVAPDIHATILGQRIDNTWRPNDTSFGYQLRMQATYSQVFGGPVTLIPSVAFKHDAYGTTPDAGAQFIQGRMAVATQLEAQYQNDWKGLITYSNAFGNDRANFDTDRDFFQVAISYAF